MIKTATAQPLTKLTEGNINIKTLELYWDVAKLAVDKKLQQVNAKYYLTKEKRSPKHYAELISSFGDGYSLQVIDIYRKINYMSICSIKEVELIKVKLTSLVKAEFKKRTNNITEGRDTNLLLMIDAYKLVEAAIAEKDNALQRKIEVEISCQKKERRENRNKWLHDGFIFALGILSTIIIKYIIK